MDDATTRKVWAAYSPEDCHEMAGWLWCDIDGTGQRWHLVCTNYAFNDSEVVRFIDTSEEDGGEDFADDADGYRGKPYLPCSEPTVEPGKCDAGEVIVRLASGASVVFGFSCPLDAEAAMRAVLDVHTGQGVPRAGTN